ncbi:CalY family protein [Dietzia cinnamea]|uniref:CalY family protein n=1 Tax=Dietzia cinnamea TaxID=321318 RepID=UPI0021A48F03|nr:CalY family protein [Dietzia cinnamea]MCT1885725.1 CalY family protein [Dietzia cinnamea]
MATLRKNPRRDYRWRESGWTRARAVLALGMVFGLGTVGTMAQWSQTVTAETGLFSSSAGTVDLTINDTKPNAELSGISQLGRGGSGSTTANLKNTGTVNLKYSVDLAVAELSNQTGSTGQVRGNASSLRQNMTVSLYSGTTCTGTAIATKTAPTVAKQTLQTDVDLAAGATKSYCILASVSSTAPVESRMAQAGLTFSFNASIA